MSAKNKEIHTQKAEEAKPSRVTAAGFNMPLSDTDGLLSCLVWFTHYFHKPFSKESLLATLPLQNNVLTLEFFSRAAKRGDLTATHVFKPWSALTAYQAYFPVLVLTDNHKPLILLKTDIKKNTVHLLDPECSMGEVEMPVSDFEKHYRGDVVFMKPVYHFTRRSQEQDSVAGTDPSAHAPPKSLRSLGNHWFWTVILSVWPLYTEVLIASLLINLFAVAVPLFAMNVYDRVVPNESYETLWVLSLGIFIVFSFDFLMRGLRSYFIDWAGSRVDIKLSARIFEQIMGIQMGSRSSSVGAFSNTIQSFEHFRDFITSSTVTVLVDLPFTLIFILMILVIGGNLALIPLLIIPVVILAGWLIQIPLTALTQASYQSSNEKQAILIETLGGIETIKSVGAESNMQRRWEQINGLCARFGIKLRWFSNLNVYFSVFIQQVAYMLVIIWGVYKIADGTLTTGGLIACSILVSRALSPMSQVAALLGRYYQARHALQAVDTVMKLPTEKSAEHSPLHPAVFKGAVEFSRVDFTYPDQPLITIKEASFVIHAGEKVGIIGRMGSGKTTLAKLMLGLYSPSSGLVLLDGLDQHQLDAVVFRQSMGYVSQDVKLFYGSIRDNIVLGAPYLEDPAVLKAVQVGGVDAFTQMHPQGLSRQVGEGGANLSGGQRQCIAIARAVLRDPSVLIFDEATSAMDDKTEQLLKNRLSAYLIPKTFILITHKASMLSLVNRLIILETGRVIADGPKDEIIQLLSQGKIKIPL